MSGWICLHRKLLKWEWYDDINTSRLFLHCLLRANHAPGKWHGIDIPAGSFISGRKVLSKETKLSERNIRTCLAHLISTNDLTVKATNRYSLITVVNWASYQDKELNRPANRPAESPTGDQRPTNDRPLTTIKQLNNDNKLNNKTLWLAPDWLNKKAWSEFEAHRKEIKKPLTDLSRTKAANQLEGYSDIQQQSIIDKSIQGRWAGLFPDKQSQPDKHSGFKGRDYKKGATKIEDISWMNQE